MANLELPLEHSTCRPEINWHEFTQKFHSGYFPYNEVCLKCNEVLLHNSTGPKL